MRDWNHLGVVDTIYEDECEFSSSSASSSSSLSLASVLQHRVEAWSKAAGREPDISILVLGTCFHLHKDLLTSRSSYLKRHLTELSHFTLSPPLNITADTFALVAYFCYSSNVQITPSNVGALRTASELLGMNKSRGNDDDSLCQLTEASFRGFVGFNQEHASMVLRSCLPLLPEAETTASLVSRCIEALISADDDSQNVDFNFEFLDDIVEMQPEDFQMVVASMNKRIRSHDVLYKFIDFYLTENNSGKLTEEQKIQICNSIDCTKLSTKSLIECIQNPTMPLRFIVRAMLVDQLNSRKSIVSDAQVRSSRQQPQPQPLPSMPSTTSSLTLGHCLQRESAVRQATQLKEAMDSTSARIRSLEKELSVMSKFLRDHQADEEQRNNILLESGRSVSFHFVPTENSKIERGERRCASLRFDSGAQGCAVGKSSSSEGSGNVGTPRMNKTFGQRLIRGIKNAFRVSTSSYK